MVAVKLFAVSLLCCFRLPKEFCAVYFERPKARRYQINASANSVFGAAWEAIKFTNWENWKGPRPLRSSILEVHVGRAESKVYRVRALRVLEHFREDPKEWLD